MDPECIFMAEKEENVVTSIFLHLKKQYYYIDLNVTLKTRNILLPVYCLL